MKPKRPGRPLIGKNRRENFTVSLDPAVAKKLRALGKGNLSRGIEVALSGITPPAPPL